MDCVAFLNQLLHIWCEGASDRSAERQNVTLSAKLACGFDLIYAHIANKPFKSSKPATSDIDTAAHKQIAAIGHTFTESNLPNIEQLESWTIENESILGARLIRENKEGERIGNNQLIALRTKDAKAFMLGTVRWRSVTHSGQLQMGVQYLPGVAQAHYAQNRETDPAAGEILSGITIASHGGAQDSCQPDTAARCISRQIVRLNWFMPARKNSISKWDSVCRAESILNASVSYRNKPV